MGSDTNFADEQFRGIRGGGGSYERDLVFVCMPFTGDKMSEAYSIMQEECEKLGLVASRVDQVPGSGFVLKHTTDLIERAEFLVFDLSYSRPNVYYELGYAHGVGNLSMEILLIARRGADLHFNIAPLQVRLYDSLGELRAIVSSGLASMMRATRD